MKYTFFLGLALAALVGCQPAIESQPTPTGYWQPVRTLKHPIRFIDQTANQLIIGDSTGLTMLDQTNTIRQSVLLNDPTTADVLLALSNRYAIFTSLALGDTAKLYLANVSLSIYRFDQPAPVVPFRRPLRQVLISPGTAQSYEVPLVRCVFCTNGYYQNYRSALVDDTGKLYLAYVVKSAYANTYRLHYYKYAIAQTGQQQTQLQLIQDQLTELSDANVAVDLRQFNNQFYRITNTISPGPQTELVQINMGGTDQVLLKAFYQIDNLFRLGSTLYVIANNAELWSLADGQTAWQKVKTLTSAEYAFFKVSSAADGALPLTALVNQLPLIKTDLNAPADTVSKGQRFDRFYRVGSRYFGIYQDQSSLVYSDNPFVYRK